MRIFIADDSELVRRAVVTLLSVRPDWQVCGQVGDGAQALSQSRELKPDLVLLDISMPGPSGLETARELRDALPRIKILIMSHHDPNHILRSALQAGADACIDKARLGADLIPAIQNLLDVSFRALSAAS